MISPGPERDPGTNWLDRLRSSKGLPPLSAELDLDHFLLPPDSNPGPSPAAAPPSRPRLRDFPKPDGEKGVEPGAEGRTWFEIVGSALAELFHMTDPSDGSDRRARRGGQKNPRKQPKPRTFAISAAASGAASNPTGEVGDCGGLRPSALPAGADNGVAGEKTKSQRRRTAPPPCNGGWDSSDLAAFTRTEVTVIDTSSPSWKSQKIIFRKGSIWRIRDKKSWSVSKKKRKLSAGKKLPSQMALTKDESPSPTEDRTFIAEDASATQIRRHGRKQDFCEPAVRV